VEGSLELSGLVRSFNRNSNNNSNDDASEDDEDRDDDHGATDRSPRHHGGGPSNPLFWRRNANTTGVYEYGYIDDDDDDDDHRFSWWRSPKLLCLIAAFLIVSLVAIYAPDQPQETEDSPVVPKYKGAPQYTCPAASSSSNNNNMDDYNSQTIPKYQNDSEFMQDLAGDPQNLTTYAETFRDLEFRDWGKTYHEVKGSLVHWKESRFVPNLKTGDSIFESGCGIGLSLYMTLEILQEQTSKNLRDLHLYGSDVSSVVAGTANLVLDKILSGESVGGGKRGVICAADSIQLSDFIPKDTFDLVFSSRIQPVAAGLGYNVTTPEQLRERRRDICATRQTDWKSAALQEAAQERQNDWYGTYVAAMVRIAKPGAAVIVEQVSDPYCDEEQFDEWGGGVHIDFWTDAVETYGWDVDPESIEFGMDTLFQSKHRYHVFMRKNRH